MKRITRRLTEAEAAAYKDKTPLAVGYKIFNWDWTGKEYCYADADGIVEGMEDCEIIERRYEFESQSAEVIKALKQEGMVNFIDVRSAMWHGLLGV